MDNLLYADNCIYFVTFVKSVFIWDVRNLCKRRGCRLFLCYRHCDNNDVMSRISFVIESSILVTLL